MQIKKILAVGIFSLLAFSFISVLTVRAENIVDVNFPCPGSDIPGFPKCERQPDGVPTNDFVGYMLQAYQFGIGIVGIIAVGMIVYGGILIAWNTESIDKRGKGREMITSALTGIVVLFGSYLILNTINPELVKFNLAANLPDLEKGKVDLSKDLQKIECGDPASIQTTPEHLSVFENCAVRTRTISKGINIQSDKYYDESEEILEGAKIWTYPYFIKDVGPEGSKRCLIYAYTNPFIKRVILTPPYFEIVPGTNKKIDLQDTLTLCKLSKNQSTGQSDPEHAENLAKLVAAGVEIQSSGNCSDINNKACTSLTGMPSRALDFLVSLANKCNAKNPTESGGCRVIVTGGTEIGHTEHGSNLAVFDLSSGSGGSSLLGEYLLENDNVKKICTSNGPEKAFRKKCSTVEEIPHFHVSLQ
jgi:hypothetical protein